MIYRTTTTKTIADATEGHHGDDFVVDEWVKNPANVALVNDRGDVNLFQFEREGLFLGHFFYVSRGREALKAAREMLAEIFKYEEVKVLMGLTPVDKLGARWLTRKLGFTSYGIIETPSGDCEMFVLSRPEYEKDAA